MTLASARSVGPSRRFWPALFAPVQGSEQHQALSRVVGGGVFLLLLLVLQASGFAIGQVWYCGVAYLLFALMWRRVVTRALFRREHRLLIALVMDNVILASGFMMQGETLPLLLWAPLCAAIGYGLRYGARYAWASVGVAMAVTIPSLVLSDNEAAHSMLALGYLLGLVILPAYAVRLAELGGIDRRALEEKAASLEVASRTDSLTGVLNRRGLLSSLGHHLAKLALGTQQSALIYIDLDGFKRVNDIAGHAVGDRVLETVARRIASCLRPTDQVSRLGGDEFVAVLGAISSPDDSVVIAQRILEQIGLIHVEHHAELHIGASIGICTLPNVRVATPQDAINLADQLMYRAKQNGKNRIFLLANGG